jgi:hypothetical protein
LSLEGAAPSSRLRPGGESVVPGAGLMIGAGALLASGAAHMQGSTVDAAGAPVPDDGAAAEAAGADSGNTPYGDLKDPVSVGPGKPFSKAQKDKIYEANRQANGGQLTDDYTGEPLLPPQQSQRRVTPSPNEAQVDH